MLARVRRIGALTAVACASALLPAAVQAATLDSVRDERVAEIDPRFLSFGIDISQMTEVRSRPRFDFNRPRLANLVAPLSPAVIRFSGTKIDQTYYDDAGGLGPNPPGAYLYVLDRQELADGLAFADATGLDVNLAINAGPGPRDDDYGWDPANARVLLERAIALGHPPDVVSFGNEPNITYYGAQNPTDYGAAEYEADVDAFDALRSELVPGATFVGPGPFLTTGEERPLFGAQFGPDIADLMPRTGGLYDAVSFHQYPAFGNSDKCLALQPRLPYDPLASEFLDRVDGSIAYMSELRDGHAPGRPLWVDEMGNTACGGIDGYSDTFGASFYYLNQLGAMAAAGVAVASRWTIAGPQPYALIDDETLEPRPDYWAALLWKRTMGTTVVEPRLSDAPDTLRAYATCSPSGPGAVTTLLLNTSRTDPATVDVASGDAELRLVTADPADTRVRLNGGLLEAGGDGSPPATPGAAVGGEVELPPAAYAFLTEPGAAARACGGPLRRLVTGLEARPQTIAAVRRRGEMAATCSVDDAARCSVKATVAPRLARRMGLGGKRRALVAEGEAMLSGPGRAPLRLKLRPRFAAALPDRRNDVRVHLAASADATDRGAGSAHARLVLAGDSR